MSENGSSSMVTTKELKRVLGFKELFLTAIGQIIGGGIMSLTGIAIARAGHAVPVAFLLSAVIVILITVPRVLLCGTVRMRGGEYTMIGLLAGEKFAGVFVWLHIAQNIAIAMYALSFADYFMAFLPSVDRKVIAIIVLTVFYLLNLFGIDKMAKVQNLIVGTMCVSLGLFCAFGLTKVHYGAFAPATLFEHGGVSGMLSAAVLLIYATSGASAMMNLSAEAKDPVRDLPKAMISSTFVVAILYAIMGIVASGVLAIDTVANQSLAVVAKEILPAPLYVFFVVGGCMFALISTLNSQFAWATKPIMQACVDGWLPAGLGAVTKKYRTPYILLSILYVLGLVCILFNLDLDIIATITVIINQLMYILVNINIVRLPKILPAQWNKSKFKVSNGVLVTLSVVAVAMNIVNIWLVAHDYSLWVYAANIGCFVLAYIYAVIRMKSGKVHMEISYEDQ